jgi:hypothetical protein
MNVTLRFPKLVEGKLYYSVDFDGSGNASDVMRYPEWVARLGTGLSGQEFALTAANGTYTMRVPSLGRTSTFTNTAYADVNGDLNPNSSVYDDWSALADATDNNIAAVGGWSSVSAVTSTSLGNFFNINSGSLLGKDHSANWSMVVELVL